MKNKNSILLILIFHLGSGIYAQDFSYDEKIGAESAVQVEQTIGIYNDSSLNDYVQTIGKRLVSVLGTPPVTFRFSIVDMSEPNAFALPGGYIYVSRGLLSLVNDEAELACVMGHEMIHVTKRHSVKQMRKGILPGLLHIPGAIVGVFNQDLGRIINAPISFGSELILSNYSRKQETESDNLGIKLASQAGYDPSKLADILNHIAEDVELLTGEDEKKSYFSSHPFTPKRIERIEKELKLLDWTAKPAIAGDKQSLYEKLDGMYIGQNPKQGVIEDNVFKHPDLNLTIKFPKKWNTLNVPVAVGAVQPDGEAQIVFMTDDPKMPVDSIGKAFADLLREKYEIIPTKDKSLEINGFEAFEVAMTDNSGEKPVDYQVYWIKADKILFNVMGVSYRQHSETVTAIVQSLRLMSEAERLGIQGIRLRKVMVLEGETIDELSARTKNVWDKRTTIVKNGLESENLQNGQVLKVAVEEPYIVQ
jgi:predicted Zn-dependent protease